MSLEIKGKIKLINPTETFGSGFTKREFVITTAEQYPQDVKFEVVKDKVALLDNFTTGQEITVQFNIRGNEYGGKYYVSLQAWKLIAGQSAPPQKQSAPPQAVSAPVEDIDADMLPF
jgi:hypothetical protein